MNPGPLAPEARIIPLDQAADAAHPIIILYHYYKAFGKKFCFCRSHSIPRRESMLLAQYRVKDFDCNCRDSSVGRASDWRSEGPRFDLGSRHFPKSTNSSKCGHTELLISHFLAGSGDSKSLGAAALLLFLPMLARRLAKHGISSRGASKSLHQCLFGELYCTCAFALSLPGQWFKRLLDERIAHVSECILSTGKLNCKKCEHCWVLSG